MISYFQSTYNSGRIAQTYLLASKVKAKLTQEAVKNDVNLHRLVCQANLLDNLVENLNNHETKHVPDDSNDQSANNDSYSYDTINYPLLNGVSVHTNNENYEYIYNNDDNENNEDNNEDTHAKKSDIYYTSDDSDFDSEDDDDNTDYDYNYNDDSETTLCRKESNIDSCHLYSLGLERLNIESRIKYDNSDEGDGETTINQCVISYNGFDSDEDSENEEHCFEFDHDLDYDCEYDNSLKLERMHSYHNSNTTINITSEPVEEHIKSEIPEEDLPSLSNCSSVSSIEELSPISDLKSQILSTDAKSLSLNENQNNPEDVLII